MKKVTAMLFSMAVGLNAVSMAAKAKASEEQETDVLLIGGGIMSATLGTYLRELEPEWSMTMVERLEGVAQESSNGWNNAGTGHSALMELNYTPQNADGSISIEKAVAINEAFQISRQFWAHQVERGVLRTPRSFINTVPHMSFVWGGKTDGKRCLWYARRKRIRRRHSGRGLRQIASVDRQLSMWLFS